MSKQQPDKRVPSVLDGYLERTQYVLTHFPVDHHNRNQLREHLKTVRYTGAGEVKEGWLDETMQLIDQYAYEYAERVKPNVEIAAKIKALDKLIMGAGEYHDDPYEYVIRLSDAREYRDALSKFDLSEPIFKELSPHRATKDHKISLCNSCNCMTKTIDSLCGKCGATKDGGDDES